MTKIDVLAVMDKLQEAVDALGREGERRYHRDGMFHLELGPKHYSSMMLQDELIEARAAVAELIEAVIHLRSCSGDEGSDDGSVADLRLDAAKRRVDEALENCGVKA